MTNLNRKDKQQREEEQLCFQEESFINEEAYMLELNEQMFSVVLMNSSLNRSGISCDTTQYIEQHTQTEPDNQHQPKKNMRLYRHY